MKAHAVLKTESKDAGSISSALSVDNVQLSGLNIRTREKEGKIVTEVESENIRTLIRALDDIICCQMVAEKTIN